MICNAAGMQHGLHDCAVAIDQGPRPRQQDTKLLMNTSDTVDVICVMMPTDLVGSFPKRRVEGRPTHAGPCIELHCLCHDSHRYSWPVQQQASEMILASKHAFTIITILRHL